MGGSGFPQCHSTSLVVVCAPPLPPTPLPAVLPVLGTGLSLSRGKSDKKLNFPWKDALSQVLSSFCASVSSLLQGDHPISPTSAALSEMIY